VSLERAKYESASEGEASGAQLEDGYDCDELLDSVSTHRDPEEEALKKECIDIDNDGKDHLDALDTPDPHPRPWHRRSKLGKWEKLAIEYLYEMEAGGKPLIAHDGKRWAYVRANFRRSALKALDDRDRDDCLFLIHMRMLADLHDLPYLPWMPNAAVRAGLRIRVMGILAPNPCNACRRDAGRHTKFRVHCYYIPGAGGRCAGCSARSLKVSECSHAFTPFNPSLAATRTTDVEHLHATWEALKDELEECADNIDAMQDVWVGASEVVDRLEMHRDRMDAAVARIGTVYAAFQGYRDCDCE